MTTLDLLPPEVLTEIALALHSPLTVDEYDLLSGEGIFNSVAGERRRCRLSLVALGATCWTIREIVRPLLFRCVNIDSISRADWRATGAGNNWKQHVRILKLEVPQILPLSVLNNVADGVKVIKRVLLSLPATRHLEFSIEFTVETQVVMAILGATCHSDPELQKFFSTLESLAFRFLGAMQEGMEPSYNTVALTFPFLESTPRLQFLIIEDDADHEREYNHGELCRLLPSSLRSLTLKGPTFWSTKTILKESKLCKGLRHIFHSRGNVYLEGWEDRAEYWSAFPLLKSFCCGKYPVINDKGALELAELCPTLLVIGDAVGFGTGWIVDRSEELEIFMYRRGDFHRLEAEEQARIATKRQAQNGGQRL